MKYLYLKRYGVYPEHGFNHTTHLPQFDMYTLEFRRVVAGLMFLYKLLHNRIDCSFISEHHFEFHILMLETCHSATFHK